MRVVSKKLIEAINSKKSYSNGTNTKLHWEANKGIVTLYRTQIAIITEKTVEINFHRFTTNTTCERIHSLIVGLNLEGGHFNRKNGIIQFTDSLGSVTQKDNHIFNR